MAVRQPGFTRASSLGPIAEVVDWQGASIARLLNDVDLPLALLDAPETLLPLREQFRLLERAARATGEAHFGARLGQQVRMRELSAFGRWVSEAATLAAAIERAHRGLNAMLQTSTVVELKRVGDRMTWSIEFLDPECDGRYQNELLGASYMIDCVRFFAGAGWAPDYVLTTAPRGDTKSELEEIFRAEVSTGHAVTTIAFDPALLACGGARGVAAGPAWAGDDEPPLPSDADAGSAIAAVMSLALTERAPRLEWVAAKLGLSPRSLQRKLQVAGSSYHALLEDVMRQRATRLVADTSTSIVEIALMLGYSDQAHFTRAFRRWTGHAPGAYRAQIGAR
jgi:AraC-like DNA-binding protein